MENNNEQKNLVIQDPEEILNNPELNLATKKIMDSVPEIYKRARTLSAKQVSRVLAKVLEFPLDFKTVNFQRDEEHHLFVMCTEALSARDLMRDYVRLYNLELSKREKALKEQLTAEAEAKAEQNGENNEQRTNNE